MITTKQFQILTDINLVWKLMTEVYDHEESNGPAQLYEDTDLYFDFRTGSLDYPLPAGYHFTNPKDNDPLKVARCLWDSFNKWELGEFMNWETPVKNGGRSPHELYQNVLGATLAPAPHATYDYTTVIADADDNYVCFAGMWWVPENKLAYLEPLCTVPEHQHKGLAAAALSYLEKILRPLGAAVITGGGNEFYRKLGYKGVHVQGHYVKP